MINIVTLLEEGMGEYREEYREEYQEEYKRIYNQCYHEMRKELDIKPFDFIQDESFFESGMDKVFLLLCDGKIIGSVALKGDEIDDLILLLLSDNLINKKLNNWEYCINELNQNYFSSNLKLAKFWKYRAFDIPNYNRLKKEAKICTVKIFCHWLISLNRNIII